MYFRTAASFENYKNICSIPQLRGSAGDLLQLLQSSSGEEVVSASVGRNSPFDKCSEHGPFDIIGDVHGCFDELLDLLTVLGYQLSEQEGGPHLQSPAGRKLVFVGDLVDRGPAIPRVLKLVLSLVASGQAFCVLGNHDLRLVKALRGQKLPLTYGLGETLEQMASESPETTGSIADFLQGLVSHYIFDDGRLVVAHAGMPEALHGSSSTKARDVAVHGEKTGETDQFGDIRYAWANDYRGKAFVVYGHTPVVEPLWLNNTVNIDTGAVFGGCLTALRYPERETVSVPARKMYFEPTRPFLPTDKRLSGTLEQGGAGTLDLENIS